VPRPPPEAAFCVLLTPRIFPCPLRLFLPRELISFASTSLTVYHPEFFPLASSDCISGLAEAHSSARLARHGIHFITSIPGEDHSGAIYLYAQFGTPFSCWDWKAATMISRPRSSTF